MPPQTGLQAELRRVVSPSMTAEAYANPGFAVLGTPALVGLFEEAGMRAIANAIAPNEGSVGTRISDSHVAPTPLGEEVRVRARLSQVEGRRLVFALDASDPTRQIATREMERFIVDVSRFMTKAIERKA